MKKRGDGSPSPPKPFSGDGLENQFVHIVILTAGVKRSEGHRVRAGLTIAVLKAGLAGHLGLVDLNDQVANNGSVFAGAIDTIAHLSRTGGRGHIVTYSHRRSASQLLIISLCSVTTSRVSLGMLARMEAEESAAARRLRRPPVTVPKMRVIILSRPFLSWGIQKAELRKEAPPFLCPKTRKDVTK